MSPMVKKIEGEISKLSADEQAELLEHLESLVYGADEEDPVFVETLKRRVREIESGTVKGLPVEKTFQKIDQELKAKFS